MRAKEIHLQKISNKNIPDKEHFDMTFGTGCLARFFKPINLKSLKTKGESSDADDEAVRVELPKLREKQKKYER